MMERLSLDRDITLFSRFECKYLVSPLLVPEIRAFLHPFVELDRYAARHPDGRYAISSLYLDSDDLLLYQQTVGGEKNRFKLRVRTYSDGPTSPAFFEVKRKVNNIVQKRRCRLERADALAFLESERAACGDDDLAYFAQHRALTSARPVIRIRYMREAYQSRGGDPVRVTLDTELMHAVTLDHDLSHVHGRWVTTPVDGVILEIKFTELYPTWVRDLVQMFGLKQQPVPKYILSLDHMLGVGRESVLSMAGFTLPMRRI